MLDLNPFDQIENLGGLLKVAPTAVFSAVILFIAIKYGPGATKWLGQLFMSGQTAQAAALAGTTDRANTAEAKLQEVNNKYTGFVQTSMPVLTRATDAINLATQTIRQQGDALKTMQTVVQQNSTALDGFGKIISLLHEANAQGTANLQSAVNEIARQMREQSSGK